MAREKVNTRDGGGSGKISISLMIRVIKPSETKDTINHSVVNTENSVSFIQTKLPTERKIFVSLSTILFPLTVLYDCVLCM